VGLVVMIFKAIWVGKQDSGDANMVELAGYIARGSQAFLRAEWRVLGVFVVIAAALLAWSAELEAVAAHTDWVIAVAFVIGAVFSAFAGWIGMNIATKANVRTTQAARTSLAQALKVSFTGGTVMGLGVAGLAVLGLGTLYIVFTGMYDNVAQALEVLAGFSLGAESIALFARVGGGIYTKAADVGADLVGKVEAGIPEDDPRNPATIADNVGDNVGDCAGMAADLFESYEVTLVASIILGVAAFNSIGLNPAMGLVFPLAARAIGVIASIAGVFAVKAKESDTDALKPINRGFLVAGSLTLAGTLALALTYVGNAVGEPRTDGKEIDLMSNAGWRVFGAVAIGLVLAQLVSRLTEYYTGTHYKPVKEIAESAETGPATVVLSGTAYGLESSVYAVIAIAISIGVALALGGGNLTFSLYLVALTGMGMLATTGVIVSEDTFGPVSDNAAGIAEMSGEFKGEAQRIMVSLDAVGNTTKAVTKGFAIGSAVIAAVALFASFIEIAGAELAIKAENLADGVFKEAALAINVADPKVFIGLLIGGSVPFLFSALSIRAVGRTAGVVVQEVRNQFADGLIMKGKKKPDYGPVIDICTQASLRELTTPALLAVLTPVIVGFGIGWQALGGFLAAVILTGQLMANYLSNAGGAWDNSKKYIEDGHHGGKGSEAHKAAVIGDTVGDPFKDTAGPALNPLIKVMNLVSLLVLPAIISTQDNDGQRIAIAVVGPVVLIGSIVRSSRQSSVLATRA
jgi:K(+)-stimulated pyrophosphate-energized sodium pump